MYFPEQKHTIVSVVICTLRIYQTIENAEQKKSTVISQRVVRVPDKASQSSATNKTSTGAHTRRQSPFSTRVG